MKFLVIGLGSIGKRHIMNMISLGISQDDIAGIDPREDRRNETKRKFGITRLYPELDEVGSDTFACDAALICSPTSLHMKQAIRLAKEGIHLLIEKPLSNNLEGIHELSKLIEKNSIKVLVAYIFRFAPSVKKLKVALDSGVVGRPLYARGEFSEYLPDWHPWEDYRTFYMAQKTMGGGSILDQTHIIDLAHYLFGDIEQVYCVNGRFSDLEVQSDDMAEIMARFKSGLNMSIHMDMFGRSHRKDMEIKGTQGNIIWNFYDYSVKVYHGQEKRWESWTFNKDPNEMYICEMQHFLDCIENNEEPMVPLEQGVHTMKVVLSCGASSRTNKPIIVDQGALHESDQEE